MNRLIALAHEFPFLVHISRILGILVDEVEINVERVDVLLLRARSTATVDWTGFTAVRRFFAIRGMARNGSWKVWGMTWRKFRLMDLNCNPRWELEKRFWLAGSTR